MLVVALGADLDPSATPGLVEDGHDFYTEAGAFALREVLDAFPGGRRDGRRDLDAVQVPARPQRGRSCCSTSTSATVACASSPGSASCFRSPARSRRRRTPRTRCWRPSTTAASSSTRTRWCAASTPRGTARVLADGRELDYDLFLAVPTHRAPRSSSGPGLTVDGWIPVDPETLDDPVAGRLRRRRRHQRRHPQGRRLRRGTGRGRGRGDHRRAPRHGRAGGVRRTWRLLRRVRRRRSGDGRRDLPQRPGTDRRRSRDPRQTWPRSSASSSAAGSSGGSGRQPG